MKLKKNSKDPVQKAVAKLFLNSLYGRFGMKEIDSIMEIVNKQEAETLDRNTNVTVFSELAENKILVKHSGVISDKITNLYSINSSVSNNIERNKYEKIIYSKGELRESGLNKTRNVPSAVHIAAAISSYARILIN